MLLNVIRHWPPILLQFGITLSHDSDKIDWAKADRDSHPVDWTKNQPGLLFVSIPSARRQICSSPVQATADLIATRTSGSQNFWVISNCAAETERGCHDPTISILVLGNWKRRGCKFGPRPIWWETEVEAAEKVRSGWFTTAENPTTGNGCKPESVNTPPVRLGKLLV